MSTDRPWRVKGESPLRAPAP
ncbi:protein of unknown function [Candidatus Nitrospira inopinata]|uniref:Uncharacterized protein n=1 Tax=Candidatus Nitrospira inopinata TaxID=1715989 RepID=A0A0S4KP59_9BACT|nr:protein of unknown function [Candidatus Nitrospira inopinata]